MDDDIAQAVLSRDEVARYLGGGPGLTPDQAHQQISAYLEELKTTQRYSVYRALKHPLYPILRKIQRHPEHVELAPGATRSNRVVYVSNHKSHLDYLVELLVLDDSSLALYRFLDERLDVDRSFGRWAKFTRWQCDRLVVRAAQYGAAVLLAAALRAGGSATALGGMPVVHACEQGALECVRVLLADPRVHCNARRNLALRRASANGHAAVVALLLAREEVDPGEMDSEALRSAAQVISYEIALGLAVVGVAVALLMRSKRRAANTFTTSEPSKYGALE